MAIMVAETHMGTPPDHVLWEAQNQQASTPNPATDHLKITRIGSLPGKLHQEGHDHSAMK